MLVNILTDNIIIVKIWTVSILIADMLNANIIIVDILTVSIINAEILAVNIISVNILSVSTIEASNLDSVEVREGSTLESLPSQVCIGELLGHIEDHSSHLWDTSRPLNTTGLSPLGHRPLSTAGLSHSLSLIWYFWASWPLDSEGD